MILEVPATQNQRRQRYERAPLGGWEMLGQLRDDGSIELREAPSTSYGKCARKACCCALAPVKCALSYVAGAVLFVAVIVLIILYAVGWARVSSALNFAQTLQSNLQSTALSYVSSDADIRLWRRTIAPATNVATASMNGLVGWIEIRRTGTTVHLSIIPPAAGTLWLVKRPHDFPSSPCQNLTSWSSLNGVWAGTSPVDAMDAWLGDSLFLTAVNGQGTILASTRVPD